MVTNRQLIALTCAAILSAAVVAILLSMSQRLSLRSSALAYVEPTFGVGHVWWMASAGLLLLIAALAAAYDRDDISPVSIGLAAAMLLLAPALVFTNDGLAAWVTLSAALGGFYFATVRFRVALSLRGKAKSLPWFLPVLVFAAAVVGVTWAILFLE